MAIRTRIDPIGRDLDLIIDEMLSPEAQGRVFAAYAREQLGEAQQINQRVLGRVPDHETIVDGRRAASLDSAKVPGSVVFEFELVGDAIEWIQEQLLKHSPFRSGRFRKSHMLFAGDVEVQFGAEVPPGKRYVFVNSQPYARKLERRTADGIFQAVAVLANKRFGNMVSARFGYHSLQGGAVGGWASVSKISHRGHANARSRQEWLTRQPAIFVTVK